MGCGASSRQKELQASGGLDGRRASPGSNPNVVENHLNAASSRSAPSPVAARYTRGPNSKAAPTQIELFCAQYSVPLETGDLDAFYTREERVPELGDNVWSGERRRDMNRVLLVKFSGDEAAFARYHERLSASMLATRRTPYLANVLECWVHTGPERSRSRSWSAKQETFLAERWVIMTAPPGGRSLKRILEESGDAVPRLPESVSREIVLHVLRALKKLHEGSLPVEDASEWRSKGVKTWVEGVSGGASLTFREVAFVLGTAEPEDVFVSGYHGEASGAGGASAFPVVLQAAIGGLETLSIIDEKIDGDVSSRMIPKSIQPPEAESGRVTTKADLWAVGRLTCALLGAPDLQTSSKPTLPTENISEAAKDFVQRCFEPDPANRISAAQASKHPWIRGIVDPEGIEAALAKIDDPDEDAAMTISGAGAASAKKALYDTASKTPLSGIGGSGIDSATLFRDPSEPISEKPIQN